MDLFVGALELNDPTLFRQYLQRTPSADMDMVIQQALIYGAGEILSIVYDLGVGAQRIIEQEGGNLDRGETNRISLADLAILPESEDILEDLLAENYIPISALQDGRIDVVSQYLSKIRARLGVIPRDIPFGMLEYLIRRVLPDTDDELRKEFTVNIGSFFQEYQPEIGRRAEPEFYDEIATELMERGYDSDLVDVISTLIDAYPREMVPVVANLRYAEI